MSELTVKALVCGTEYELKLNESTGKYEATVPAPIDSSYQFNSGGYFPVTLSATDEANNTTVVSDIQGEFKENLKLYVKEKKPPKVTEFSPSEDAVFTTSYPKIEFTVLDNANGQPSGFSGINPDSIVLTVGGTAVNTDDIIKEPVTGGYKCTYTPTQAIPDGKCTYTVEVSDYDGNKTETSVMFKIDVTPPALNILFPENGITVNTEEIEFLGNTADATSSPVTVSITVNGVDQGFVEVLEDGSFAKKGKLSEGVNVVGFLSTDAVGKFTYMERTVILKTKGPVFKSVEISPNPVFCGELYTISVSFEED